MIGIYWREGGGNNLQVAKHWRAFNGTIAFDYYLCWKDA
jgi:hypothetical protein